MPPARRARLADEIARKTTPPSPNVLQQMSDAHLTVVYERQLTAARLLLHVHPDQERAIDLVDETVMPIEAEMEQRRLLDSHGLPDDHAISA